MTKGELEILNRQVELGNKIIKEIKSLEELSRVVSIGDHISISDKRLSVNGHDVPFDLEDIMSIRETIIVMMATKSATKQGQFNDLKTGFENAEENQ